MLSIIIPTFQEEKTIASMLKQLRAQLNCVPYETIVSDNQSTDNTRALAVENGAKIIFSPPGPRVTIATVRNLGAAQAQYPYLVFLDSGVFVPKPNQFFLTALQCFQNNPKLVGLTGKVKILPEDKKFGDDFFCWLVDSWYQLNNNLFGVGMAYGKFQMVRAEAFKKIGGYNEQLVAGEDFDLFIRLSKIGSTYLQPSLKIFHQGRRMHQLGWLRLLSLWIINGLWVFFSKKALSKDWEAIR